ncbi:MAG: hypothetical protein AAFX58_03170 [Pseudomonadota bacterium]
MKLRIRGDSIRLRLTRGEVERIGAGETVAETTRLGAGTVFEYRLVPDAAAQIPAAVLRAAVLEIRLPRAQARAWALGDEVGISASQPVDAGATLDLLVEKDFACLAPRPGEDESDMYEHPEAGSSRC